MPPPRKPRNIDQRAREHLTEDEVERLMKAAAGLGRHGHRDRTMILLAFRHGLRVSELVALRRDQVDLEAGTMHVNRSKRGKPSTQPMDGPEIRAVRELWRDPRYPDSPYVFVTELGGPMESSGFRKIVARAGLRAGLGPHVHPHQLRHATGYALAARGLDTRTIQDFLGHRNIQHTVRYTELAPERFRNVWGRKPS